MTDLDAFRAEVRAFLAVNLDANIRDKVLRHVHLERAEMAAWHRALYTQGWIAPAWPAEYGGPGWSLEQQLAFDDECAMTGAPETVPFGLKMLGPVLLEFGTPEQRAEHLPRILDGSDWWCQGFSEPGAGSDLASLTTSARPVDGGFRVNGTKVWTTYAQHATHIFLLARTSKEERKQQGITFLLSPIDAPGITVRPLHLIDGTHEINEVVFEDVFISASGVVGNVGGGWQCARALLTHERLNAARAGKNKRELALLLDRLGLEDLTTQPDLLNLALEADALHALRDHYAESFAEQRTHGAEAPALKLVTAALTQAISRAVFDAATSDRGQVTAAIDAVLNDRKFSIFGGATQVQKDLAAATLWRMGART